MLALELSTGASKSQQTCQVWLHLTFLVQAMQQHESLYSNFRFKSSSEIIDRNKQLIMPVFLKTYYFNSLDFLQYLRYKSVQRLFIVGFLERVRHSPIPTDIVTYCSHLLYGISFSIYNFNIMLRDLRINLQEEPTTPSKPTQLTKNEETLKHKIPLILRNYEQLKEWSDLGQWLLKLQQVLQEHPSGYLPKKKLFCKRLAQCLSPVWNKAIHENALLIYELILHNLTTLYTHFYDQCRRNSKNPNYNLVEDLPLFSLGLFPFFGYSSSQCKPIVLDLLQKYYYPLGVQLIPTIGGLLTSIIVGMEDTNEEQVKKVLSSLDAACECVGVTVFYGALWMCIVRSSRTRMGAFKFLMKRWNYKVKQESQDGPSSDILKEQRDQIMSRTSSEPHQRRAQSHTPMQQQLLKVTSDADKMPNKSALVLNALLASLEDDSTLIKRAALDFLFAHAKITDGGFSRDENLVLVQACLLLFIKLDHAVVRRINNWFFGETDMNEPDRLKDMEVTQLIAQALNRILVEDHFEPTQEEAQQNSPLKIIQNWYMQHPETVELTLEHIGYQLVRYMYLSANNAAIQKASERLVESIASNCELILESLYKLLFARIKDKRVDQVLEIVRLLNYCLNTLMVNQFGHSATIKDETDIDSFKARTVSLQHLIQIILNQIVEIPPEQFFQLPLTEAVLELALQSMVKVHQRVGLTHAWVLKQDPQAKFVLQGFHLDSVEKFNKYYILVNKFATDNVELVEDRGKITIFQLIGQILLRIQVFIMKVLDVSYEHIPDWLHTILRSVQCSSPRIAISSIQILLEIIQSSGDEQTTSPGNIPEIPIPKPQSLARLLTVNEHTAILPLGDLTSLVRLSSKYPDPPDMTLSASGKNYMKEVFERLWALLDYHYQDSKVIDSILYYSKNFPAIFTFVIETGFLNARSDNDLETAIRRYQIFCRLTNPHFRKFSHENKGVGVLMMLSYLEHENPLMRHASKTWLTETAPFFFRILDPLLERLINAQAEAGGIFNPETRALQYQHSYNSEVVIDTVKKLNLLLTDIKEWYVSYIQNARISKTIQDKLRQYPPQMDIHDLKYLNLIMHILSRFIQGTVADPADPFKSDNSRVNALCCEQFEALLTNVQSKPIRAALIVQYMDTFLSYLKQLVVERDSLMQIQVLNLLKQFILSSKEVEPVMPPAMRGDLVQILSSSNFIQNMLNGLKTSRVFYLKSRYLNTLILSIYTISDLLPAQVLTERVSLILNTLLSLLRNHEYNIQEYVKKQPARSDVSEFIQQQHSQAHRVSNIDYANSQYFRESQRKEWKHQAFEPSNIDDLAHGNDELIERKMLMSSLSGENFEEVMSLSNSIKALLNFFLRFKDDIKDDPNENQNKANFQGILIDILTLNLLKSRNQQPQTQKVQQPQFAQFQDTSQMILNSLPVIISSYLYCWRLGVGNEVWSFFSTKGTTVYEYSKFDAFSGSMKEQLHKLEEEFTDDDQIKQSILSVMSPCSFQFTTELISACLQIWSSEFSTRFYDSPVQNPTMCKLMELLIMLHIEPELFIGSIMKTQQLIKMQMYYSKRLPTKKGINLLNQELAIQENNLLFFVYVYLSANLQHSLKQQQLVQLWMSILQFTRQFNTQENRVFQFSRHVNTICWMLELFYMMSWKYSPKEVLASQELRKELHSQTHNVLQTLSEFCCERQRFATVAVANDHRQSIIVNTQAVSEFAMVVPFTPVVYELYQEYVDTLNADGEKTEEMRDMFWIQRTLFDPYKQKGENLTPNDFMRKCSLIAFKTLKRIAYITLINTYEASKMDRVLENVSTKEFMAPIFPLTENKSPENLIIVEASSEIIYSLLKNSRDQLPKELKKQILDIFNGNEFFKCSRRTLKYWKEIIDWTSDKGDLLMDQLGGYRLFMHPRNQNIFMGFAGLFSSRNAETLKKIKGFERVCFIIYSGQVDKYNSKINILLDAILDAIKEVNNQHPAITILILFCIRILILRLSPQSLTQVFRKIWPSLVSMLMQIFNRKGEPLKSPNVLLAGLKLVELLSLFQLEEFYFYQWIFVFDYFGITIEMKNEENLTNKVQLSTPFEFTPYIAYQFPNLQTFTVDYENKLYPDQMQVTHGKKKRLVIIKDPQVESELEVRRQAVYLCQYLIDINQQRVEVSPQQLESLIEAEFISLDDYIFQI